MSKKVYAQRRDSHHENGRVEKKKEVKLIDLSFEKKNMIKKIYKILLFLSPKKLEILSFLYI